jgi:hypothetical protein
LTKGLIVEQPKPDRPSPQTGPAILTRRYLPQSSAEKGNRIQWLGGGLTRRRRFATVPTARSFSATTASATVLVLQASGGGDSSLKQHLRFVPERSRVLDRARRNAVDGKDAFGLLFIFIHQGNVRDLL